MEEQLWGQKKPESWCRGFRGGQGEAPVKEGLGWSLVCLVVLRGYLCRCWGDLMMSEIDPALLPAKPTSVLELSLSTQAMKHV